MTAERSPKDCRLNVLEISCLYVEVGISVIWLIFSVVTLFAKKAQRTHEEGIGKGLQGLASLSSAGIPRAPHRADPPHPERLYRRRHRLLWLRTPLQLIKCSEQGWRGHPEDSGRDLPKAMSTAE